MGTDTDMFRQQVALLEQALQPVTETAPLALYVRQEIFNEKLDEIVDQRYFRVPVEIMEYRSIVVQRMVCRQDISFTVPSLIDRVRINIFQASFSPENIHIMLGIRKTFLGVHVFGNFSARNPSTTHQKSGPMPKPMGRRGLFIN